MAHRRSDTSASGRDSATRCSIDGCDEPVRVRSRGWCNAHYKRWRRYGDPQGQGVRGRRWPAAEDRFRSRVAGFGPDECWPYHDGAATQYGVIGVDRLRVAAHRFAYELLVGPIPEGVQVLHTCDRPPCVNPAHLFLGSHQENVADSTEKGRRARPAGEQNGRAKVTAEMVAAIRAEYTGRYGDLTRLAERFGIGRTQVRRIATGERWSHL